MSLLYSTNPATGEVMQTYEQHSDQQVSEMLEKAQRAYQSWRFTDIQHRSKMMSRLADLIRERRGSLCHLITNEIGTPVDQAKSELEKCAYIAEFFSDKAEEYLASRIVEGVGSEAQIVFDPMGVVLHVAPWNYPFYLALRPVITAILAGNSVVLKHASNVPQISIAIEALFRDAGFGDVFQSMLIGSSKVESVIRHKYVSMITVIGSEKAGSSVASIAGQEIKKTLMELGGSDPFIVFEDADIDAAVEAATYSRLRNCGQSCNAAKRFIVMDKVFDEFSQKLKVAFEKFTVGDPNDTTMDMGPMATEGGVKDIEAVVQNSVEQGAKILTGGKKIDGAGNYYVPTILTHVNPNTAANMEEVFGPVAPIMSVPTVEEALRVANLSPYGLGASVWTSDIDFAKSLVPKLDCGNVYINKMVRSDPRLPFGGIKKSGYGREFSEFGLLEFTNIKSVVVN